MATRHQQLVLTVLTGLALSGCLRVKIDNKPPMAEIWLNGAAVAKSGSPAATVTIPYAGAPVSLVLDGSLDGSKSYDPDGVVTSFKWQRTDVPAASRWADGGVPPPDSGLPMFSPTEDPPSGNSASLNLDKGKARYSLWVMDNTGTISAPATVTLNVAEPMMMMAPPH
jgi:hypothetical protein